MTDRELLELALDALEAWNARRRLRIMEALRARLAQPEKEPVAWVWTVNSGAGYITRGVGFDKTDIPFAKHIPLYTAPPQREWQGLTDEDRQEIERWIEFKEAGGNEPVPAQKIITYVESKLREKNSA